MHARLLLWGLVAVAAATLVFSTTYAADTVRLGLPKSASAPTQNLKATPGHLDTETVATYFRRGAVGYRSYYAPRYVGGYFGPRFYGGYSVGYYGPRFYRPYVLPRAYYAPRYYSAYPIYSSYYVPTYDYYYGSYLTPYASSVSLTIGSRTTAIGAPPIITYSTPSTAGPIYSTPSPTPIMPRADEYLPAPTQPGTYPYDGGPSQPVPLPPQEESPVTIPRLSRPTLIDEVEVSLPGNAPKKWNYPAYGEKPSREAR